MRQQFYIFTDTTMASQGEGDDIHSTQEEPGDNVQRTGELVPGTESQAGEPPTGTTQRDEGTSETGQQAGRGEQETWMQHVRQRRRRRHERAGEYLGGAGVELPWLPPFVTRPYSAVELRNAAYEAVAVSMPLKRVMPRGLPETPT